MVSRRDRRILRNMIQRRVARTVAGFAMGERPASAVREILGREGFPLHPDAPCRFGTLVVLTYEAAGGAERETGLAGAVAMEVYMAAGYALDHVMDEEPEAGSSLGWEAACGTALLLMANAALEHAARGLPERRRARLMELAHELLLQSCAGQLEELAILGGSVDRGSFTTDDALKLTETKAGSLGRLAGTIGASLAMASPLLVDPIGQCGHYYATRLQLLDDLSDAPALPNSLNRSDFAAGKPTVPVAYLTNVRPEMPELRAGTQDAPGAQAPIMDSVEDFTLGSLESIHASGALIFTELVAEMLRNRTNELAREIHQRTGKAEGLLAFLELEQRERRTEQGLTPPGIPKPGAS